MRETNRSEVRAQDAMAVSHIAARKRDEITPQGVEGDRTKAARPTHSCTYAGNLPYTVYTPSRRRMRPRRCYTRRGRTRRKRGTALYTKPAGLDPPGDPGGFGWSPRERRAGGGRACQVVVDAFWNDLAARPHATTFEQACAPSPRSVGREEEEEEEKNSGGGEGLVCKCRVATTTKPFR
ncbi:unnamed protein product [Prorocentrum cordatum]|uniref:Uncharacterized protein n=2 Tax=Prorocentrum cordatum TaxID=2364126 RepID=A0ABN9WFX7_9DINO|nr:unnamed protein product [Polarella glacialis]